MSLLEFTIKIAEKAGKLILEKREQNLQISEKTKNDFVTNLDKESEELLIKEILTKYPNHAIIAEESSFESKGDSEKLANAEYIWIIDPIDGTKNFIRGIPAYCVSIGVFKKEKLEVSKNFDYLSGELVVGVVHAPALHETFSAEKEKGAYLNNKKIKVSNIKKLTDTIFATGFPAEHKEHNMTYFAKVIEKTGAMRRLGSAALDLCYIAAGRIDGFWEFGLKPWDIAAGSLIIEEAGGKITDTNGNPIDLFGADILASNSKIHKETVKLFRNN